MTSPVTIVSVTPVPLICDSRTLKQGMTLARRGYTSIVVADRRRWDLTADQPLDLVTLPISKRKSALAVRLRRIWGRVRRAELPAIVQFPFFLAWLVVYAYQYVWQVAIRLPTASLFCLHEFSSFPAVWLVARRTNAPIFYDAHDFYSRIEEDVQKPSFDRRFLAPFQKRLERACIARAAAVMTVSDGVADLLHERFRVKPVVLRNCHDLRLDRPLADDLRCRLGLQNNDFLLVTIGNCKRGQMIAPALDALLQLPPNVHLAFVGAGYHVHADAIATRGLASRVHLIGFLPPDELVPSVRSADASLILYYSRSVNYTAALPNGFFQSIAAELPILYPDLPEMAGVMRAAGGGLRIDPCQPASIADAVRRLLADPDAAGPCEWRRRLKERYTWAVEERIFIDQIEQALARKGHRKHASAGALERKESTSHRSAR